MSNLLNFNDNALRARNKILKLENALIEAKVFDKSTYIPKSYTNSNFLELHTSNVINGNNLSSDITMTLPSITLSKAKIGDTILIKYVGLHNAIILSNIEDTITGINTIDNGGLMILTVIDKNKWDASVILTIESQANKILDVYQSRSYEDDDAAQNGGLSIGDWYYNTTLKTNVKI